MQNILPFEGGEKLTPSRLVQLRNIWGNVSVKSLINTQIITSDQNKGYFISEVGAKRTERERLLLINHKALVKTVLRDRRKALRQKEVPGIQRPNRARH